MNSKAKTLLIAQLGILTAIEIIMALTFLGSLQISPTIVATLAHIPVIIAAVSLGKKAGLYMGFMFGALSFIVWTLMPPNPISAFLFTPFYSVGTLHGNIWSVVICFVPRILIGLFAAITYKELYKKTKSIVFSATVAAIVGTITNTVLVLLGIYLFFGSKIGAGKSLFIFIYTTAGINGLLEIAVAVILVPTIAKALHMIKVVKW